jgi:hypothetical protein
MMPCGKCEKCRRIVGMLLALDEDPKHCGYNAEQIRSGLEALSRKGVKQLGSDAAHLYYLLVTKGLLEENENTRRRAREHGEIEKLRFDSERSTPADLPKHIRKPLFEILQLYANGSVMLKERKWTEIDIDDNFLNTPYFLNKQNGTKQ